MEYYKDLFEDEDFGHLEKEDKREGGQAQGPQHYKLVKSLEDVFPEFKTRGREAIRREAAKDAAEFVVVKKKSSATPSVKKLIQSVKETGEGKAVDKVTKLVKAPSNKEQKTLDTPLEKPQAQKTKRLVQYDQAKQDVSRFNAVVYHNRLADQLTYPLNSGTKISKKSARDIANDFMPMTPLEEEISKALYGEDYVKQKKLEMQKPEGPSDAEAYMLSVEEALHAHKEMARLRALQSYQMTKAKRQNKIKSKKYHRLLRKEKIKKQLKDFEELQHKDPEAAMAKLEELDHARVQERMSLKHRNTSKWAKMQSARAKYNKDSRIALSEQLKISRDLSQKVQESSDSEDDLDLEIPQLVKSSMDNPWMLNSEVKDNDKMQLYYSGYKKLWEQINEKKEKERKQQEALEISNKEDTVELVEKISTSSEQEDNVTEDQEPQTKKNIKKIKKKQNRKSTKISKIHKNEEDEMVKGKEENAVDDDEDEPLIKSKKSQPKKKGKKRKNKDNQEEEPSKVRKLKVGDISAGDTINISSLTEEKIDELISAAEKKRKSAALNKLKQIRKQEKQERKQSLKKKERLEQIASKKKSKKNTRGDIDEIQEFEVNPEEQNIEGISTRPTSSAPATLSLTSVRTNETNLKLNKPPVAVDPNNYLKISRSKKLKSKSKFDGEVLNDINLEIEEFQGEEDEESSQRKIIAEAFEEDEVVEAFRKRKEEEIEASKPKEIDLHLPGWGEWGGKGIVPNPKRRERWIIKPPPQAPRKDARLSHVILNEEAGEKLKEHRVRELPFPFKRVKDYEKTIRAPIGRTWMPEQAVKSLIAPKVITRLGSIIEPLDEDILVKNKQGQSKELKVPISIKRLAQVKKK